MTIEERKDVPGTYVVTSGKETYNVDLRDAFTFSCDCPSGCWAPHRPCRHVLLAQRYRDGEE